MLLGLLNEKIVFITMASDSSKTNKNNKIQHKNMKV
jgi:hypothetical protein